MRGSRRCAHDARIHRLAAIENFDVNPLWRYAKSCERLFHVCHETMWPAEIGIRISRDADLVEHRSRNVTRSVEILTALCARVRPAVTNKSAGVREREYQAA